MIRLIVFIGLVFSLAFLSRELFSNWIYGAFFLLIAGGLSSFAIGLLHVKSIFRILKYG
jgi:hypothetical protein